MRVRLLIGVALLLVAGCGESPSTPPPTETYRLQLDSPAGEPGSALVSLGGITGAVQVVAGSGVLARVGDGANPLVLLVGPLGNRDLFEVTTATPGTPPSVAVVDASLGPSGQFRRLASSEVTVTWVAVD